MVEVKMTEARKTWLLEHYHHGIVWEYDPDKPFKLLSWASELTEITCRGIPYRIPHIADGKPTIKKVAS